MTALDARLAATPAFILADEWPALRNAALALAEGRHDPQRDRAFAQHTEQVEALRGLMLLAAERSGLLLDFEAHTYFLRDIGIERVLPWSETLGLLRDQGAGLPCSAPARRVPPASTTRWPKAWPLPTTRPRSSAPRRSRAKPRPTSTSAPPPSAACGSSLTRPMAA